MVSHPHLTKMRKGKRGMYRGSGADEEAVENSAEDYAAASVAEHRLLPPPPAVIWWTGEGSIHNEVTGALRISEVSRWG